MDLAGGKDQTVVVIGDQAGRREVMHRLAAQAVGRAAGRVLPAGGGQLGALAAALAAGPFGRLPGFEPTKCRRCRPAKATGAKAKARRKAKAAAASRKRNRT